MRLGALRSRRARAVSRARHDHHGPSIPRGPAFRRVRGRVDGARPPRGHRRSDPRGSPSSVRQASGQRDRGCASRERHPRPSAPAHLLARRRRRRALPHAHRLSAPWRAQRPPRRAMPGDLPHGAVPPPRQAMDLRQALRPRRRLTSDGGPPRPSQPPPPRPGDGSVRSHDQRVPVPVARPPAAGNERRRRAPARARARAEPAAPQSRRQLRRLLPRRIRRGASNPRLLRLVAQTTTLSRQRSSPQFGTFTSARAVVYARGRVGRRARVGQGASRRLLQVRSHRRGDDTNRRERNTERHHE